MLKIYIIGLFILIAAILLNALAARMGLVSWYDFLTRMTSEGRAVFADIRWLDYFWLFILYPFLLGLAGLGGHKLASILFN